MITPSRAILGGQQLAIQRWQQHNGWISFTTVIRGDALAAGVLAQANGIITDMKVGDEEFRGLCNIRDHRHSGSGPTALHRIEIRFDIVPESTSPSQSPATVDGMLQLILEEVRTLRAEVAELRADTQGAPANRLLHTTTLLDFDISLDEE